ncbi:MAG TPA: class I SAM-dependent methyltransferase, partial [Kofleriaceae bacterium]|nr:class I SAM-dependent methyltransferase [Kofleriaceae bacterium]
TIDAVRAWLVIVVLLLGASCEKKPAAGTGAGSQAAPKDDEAAREQARFDAERRPDKVVEALGIKPGSIVADVGAGSGLLTVHLARAVAPNGKVVATDVDGAVLTLLRQRLEKANLATVVEPRVVAADTPGLEPATYDAILLAEVDHYFTDAPAWLKAAGTALKPGGRIVISNRIYHRQQSMANAKKAGLELVSESTPVPTHFIAVFTVPPEAKKK